MKVIGSSVFSTGHITLVEVAKKDIDSVVKGSLLTNNKDTWRVKKLIHWNDGGKIDLFLEPVNGQRLPDIGEVLAVNK
jgi:hypothetical protein